MKMSVADAAKKLGVSKEAIHNRIRRGSMQSVVEDGVKFVVINEESAAKNVSAPSHTNRGANHTDDRYYALLREQNERLQHKIEALEKETRDLRDQKEKMLIEERIKIERIYKEKDEQLKNILNAISSKFMLERPQHNASDEEHFEAEIQSGAEEPVQESSFVSLGKYLKSRNYDKKVREKIKKRFKILSKDDSRIVIIGKKYYIDPQKYDYSDFLL